MQSLHCRRTLLEALLAGQLSPEVLELIARRFRVLAEPARLKILNQLMAGELTVTELGEATGLNQANLSKHLQMLRSSGYVKRRKEGLYAHYRIADNHGYRRNRRLESAGVCGQATH